MVLHAQYIRILAKGNLLTHFTVFQGFQDTVKKIKIYVTK